LFLEQDLAVAALGVVPERDRRIEFTGIKGAEHRTRGTTKMISPTTQTISASSAAMTSSSFNSPSATPARARKSRSCFGASSKN
jgi:hypothetical protein